MPSGFGGSGKSKPVIRKEKNNAANGICTIKNERKASP